MPYTPLLEELVMVGFRLDFAVPLAPDLGRRFPAEAPFSTFPFDQPRWIASTSIHPPSGSLLQKRRSRSCLRTSAAVEKVE